ncbi:probable ubiquitin-like-specific protease 2B isoform X2 [Mercurialis annua]|uniref:probable ubiquitin-like-specific protease 2B isoform X2 n=1 Tax=Mercurialis annua TaxID=3986 RepID=UPI002160C60A|nr:probable ubiquitin-like-specific protease 2B isoform X2 [Mercurialis annua]
MKNGLEVFDFKEEDESAEYTASKIISKFKNPNHDNPAFLECVAQGSDIAKRGAETITCVDIDRMECENGSEDATTIAPSKIVREDSAIREDNSGPYCAFQSESMSQDPCSKLDNYESKNSFATQEGKFSCHEEVSEEGIRSDCAQDKLVNEKSDANRSMNKSSSSSHASDNANNSAIESDHSSDNYFSASETDTIDMEVDYVIFRGNHCAGCLITFSCGGIKISGMSTHGGDGTFNFERAIDDIIRIESQQFQRFGTVTVKVHVQSKDVAQASNAYGVEQLEFAVVDINWSEKLEELASLNVKYLDLSDAVHNSDVMDGGADIPQRTPYFPVFDGAIEDVIYPEGDSDAVSISKRDFDLLLPETFINDTIIDFYIKYLKNRIPPEEKHRFHFFNSFFFRKLADLDKDPSSASDGRAAFLRVHKWTRKVDIFGKDYVFIPVNFSLHWSLLVICHPPEVAGFRDEDMGKSFRVPCILHMDSIKGTHAGLKNLVQSYLWEEWKSRHKETSENLASNFLNLRFVSLELPQQENSFDCGLFLLHYLELFLAEAPVNFTPFKINELSKFLSMDWFPPAEASLKRTLIQKLISVLVENRLRGFSSGDCSDEPESSSLENNAKETRVQFFSERCPQAEACHGNLSSSDAAKGIEITLLEASMRNSECINDSGLVLREFFEPGAAAGSLLGQCSSFEQPAFYTLNGAMSQQTEDDGETGDQFVYYPSGDSIYQQISGMTPQTHSNPFSSRGVGANSSWNHGNCMEGEIDGSSPETSACGSDDSELGIIESFSILKDTDLCHGKRGGQQNSLSIDNMECLTERLASGTSEMPETSATKGAEDTNGELALCRDIPAIDTNVVGNTLHQHSVKPEIISDVCDDVQTADDQRVGDNEIAESDEKHQIDGKAMENSDETERQTVDNNAMEESDGKLKVDGDNTKVESDEKQTVVENMMVDRDEKLKMNNRSRIIESDEEETAAKRRRVTHPLEGEEGDRDLDGDQAKDEHL